MKKIKAKSIIKTPVFWIIILMFFALLFPLLILSKTKQANIFSVIVSLIPLISFLTVYFVVKKTAKDISSPVIEFFKEHTEKPENIALVLHKVLGCSELALLTTIYTDVVLLKKTRMGLSRSYSIYRYVGKIKTGIQLDLCKFNIDSKTQKITVQLPEPQIFDHTIDIENMEKFDEKSSLFCKITNSELFAEITRRKEEAQQRLIEHGLLDSTLSKAKIELTQLFSAMGYLGYDIQIKNLPEYTDNNIEKLTFTSLQ